MRFFLLIGYRSRQTEVNYVNSPSTQAHIHAFSAAGSNLGKSGTLQNLPAESPSLPDLFSRDPKTIPKLVQTVSEGSAGSAVLDESNGLGYRSHAELHTRNYNQEMDMTKAELEEYHHDLLRMRDRLKSDVTDLAGEALRTSESDGGNLSNMPIHMADLGTDNFEQENTLNLLASEQHTLEEIADALDRLKQGKYGPCEECGVEIPKARLKELPFARYCISCARKMEKQS